MTLENLKEALYLNNVILLNKIKALKDSIDDIISVDIETLKNLIDNINDNDISNINNKIDNINNTEIPNLKQSINDINNTKLVNLKQLIDDLTNDLSNHTSDTIIHVTQNDKDLWNAALQNAKDYAKKLFDSVTSFSIEIVESLPTKDIKSMTIYFIRNGRDNETDYYEEYMYINNKWEIIGSTFVNLAPYLLKEDFEKYQQEITDKFAKYNTSDEITNTLKDYLLIQTFNDTIKNYSTTSDINKILNDYAKKDDLHEHNNKDILNKLSESPDGNLLFNGNEIKNNNSDITISKKENNAIQQKDDGIFVEDKTEQINNISKKINNISIAQKISYENAFVEDILWEGNSDSLNQLILNNSVFKYDEILIKHSYSTKDENIQCAILLTNNIDETYTYQVNYGNGDLNSYVKFYIKNNGTTIDILSSRTEIITEIIGRKYNQIIIDPVEYINTIQGIEDAPIGHIISYMGNNAPKHYLICDGTEYNITDYPHLAQHFMDEFGSYNYFGGDGINTFCIPDLRGEFLRGTGTATRNTGSGANVGIHQEPTENLYLLKDRNNKLYTFGNSNTNTNIENIDKIIKGSSNTGITLHNSYTSWQGNGDVCYTSRPTNTSVLYCIKYEPTYYMNINTSIIDIQEENLLENSIIITLSSTSEKSVNITYNLLKSIKEFDEIEFRYCFAYTSKQYIIPYTYRVKSSLINYDSTSYGDSNSVHLTLTNREGLSIGIFGYFIDLDKFYIDSCKTSYAKWNKFKIDIIGIKYNKNNQNLYTEEEIQEAISNTIDLLNQ